MFRMRASEGWREGGIERQRDGGTVEAHKQVRTGFGEHSQNF